MKKKKKLKRNYKAFEKIDKGQVSIENSGN